MKPNPDPPLTALPALASQLSRVGWAVPGSDAWRMLAQAQASTLVALQPVEYKALHGGIQRHFDPLPDLLLADPAWPRLLVALSGVASQLRQPGAWFVEAHPFGIDATCGIGRPTPEPQDPLLPSWRDTFVLSFAVAASRVHNKHQHHEATGHQPC